MSEKLTLVQKQLIEDNLDVVKIVILTNFRYDNNAIGLNFEDLYQVGCLSLCEAVEKYDYTTKFNTFASVVVRNKLLTYCKKTNEINSKSFYEDYLEIQEMIDFNENLYEYEILKLLENTKANSKGITLKGIIALELKIKGLSGKEIADMYGTSTNNVSAWISRAKKKLMNNTEFLNQTSYLHNNN